MEKKGHIELDSIESEILFKVRQAAVRLNMNAYVVGGFVRDKLIGRPCKDIDIVCIGDCLQLANEVANSFKFTPKVNFFKNFGTAQLKLGSIELEFVTARKESYSRDSRKPVVEPGTLEDDQKRRDFTINALAFDVLKYNRIEIIDPFDGLNDLKNKIIRTPLDPIKTYDDDPLRMLRAIRFATQLNFKIDPSSLKAIKSIHQRISIISKERIVDELNKIMMTKKPSLGFLLLDEVQLLPIFMPQLVALKGSQTIDNIGHKDNFIHSLQVLDNICENTDNLWLRYAALFHDIGKAVTKKFVPEIGWTFHGHEIVGSKMLVKLFHELKFPTTDKLAYVRKIVSLHHRPISLTKENITDSAIRRLLFDAGDDIEDLMTLCEADITSKNEFKRQRYLRNFALVRNRLKEVEEKDKIRNWQPPISGEIIMKTFGVPSGPIIGRIKDEIREAILDGVIPNDYEAAYKLMLDIASKNNLSPLV